MGVICLPRLGETMEEARVVLWLKAPGEAFARGDVLLEVETDKTVVEVPALESGVLARQLVAPGETVALGQPIAETEGGTAHAAPSGAAPTGAPAPVAGGTGSEPAQPASALAPLRHAQPPAPSRRAASPRARRLAQGAGLDLAVLPGTGRRGRVSGEDVRAALAAGAPARLAAPPSAVADAERPPTPSGDLPLSAPAAPPRSPAPGLHVRHRAPAGLATGAPLVLLHGLFDTARGWRDLPERLARAGHPVLVPDLPGHGRSPAGDGTLDGATEALAAVLPSHGPVGLVGHSLGAVLAARLAARLGPRLDRLVLVAPAGLGPRMDRDFLDLMAGARTPAALARALARLGPGAGPYSEEALAAELARLSAGREAMAALGREVAEGGVQQADIAPLLDGIAAPVTAMFGLDDPVIDWRDAANLPARVAVHFLRGAGHLPHAARPDLVADLILARGGVRDGPRGP